MLIQALRSVRSRGRAPDNYSVLKTRQLITMRAFGSLPPNKFRLRVSAARCLAESEQKRRR